IIIVTGDHLPSLQNNQGYREWKYLDGKEEDIYKVRGFVIEDGVPVDVGIVRMREIPDIICQRLSAGNWPLRFGGDDGSEPLLYDGLMSVAAGCGQ
ncbi:MAG: hypothetical protein D6741_16215, partial [Planctomycetota bacterium]